LKAVALLEKSRSKHADENAAGRSPLVGLKKPLLARSPEALAAAACHFMQSPSVYGKSHLDIFQFL
jgi:hypothetical protein